MIKPQAHQTHRKHSLSTGYLPSTMLSTLPTLPNSNSLHHHFSGEGIEASGGYTAWPRSTLEGWDLNPEPECASVLFTLLRHSGLCPPFPLQKKGGVGTAKPS